MVSQLSQSFNKGIKSKRKGKKKKGKSQQNSQALNVEQSSKDTLKNIILGQFCLAVFVLNNYVSSLYHWSCLFTSISFQPILALPQKVRQNVSGSTEHWPRAKCPSRCSRLYGLQLKFHQHGNECGELSCCNQMAFYSTNSMLKTMAVECRVQYL